MGSLEFLAGTMSTVYPTFVPALTASFIGLSHMTHTVGQLFKVTYDFTTGFTDAPTTEKNVFSFVLLSAKTCTAASTFINLVNF